MSDPVEAAPTAEDLQGEIRMLREELRRSREDAQQRFEDGVQMEGSLREIASCDPHVPGDVVDIARRTLAGRRGPRSDGAWRIATERERQVTVKNYSAKHDDRHIHGQLVQAASFYLEVALTAEMRDDAAHYHRIPRAPWPWPRDASRPDDDPIHNLERAGALIAAEIDRLVRKAERDG